MREPCGTDHDDSSCPFISELPLATDLEDAGWFRLWRSESPRQDGAEDVVWEECGEKVVDRYTRHSQHCARSMLPRPPFWALYETKKTENALKVSCTDPLPDSALVKIVHKVLKAWLRFLGLHGPALDGFDRSVRGALFGRMKRGDVREYVDGIRDTESFAVNTVRRAKGLV